MIKIDEHSLNIIDILALIFTEYLYITRQGLLLLQGKTIFFMTYVGCGPRHGPVAPSHYALYRNITVEGRGHLIRDRHLAPLPFSALSWDFTT